MIYKCQLCYRTSFLRGCPWCFPDYAVKPYREQAEEMQIPLDPSYYTEFQYKYEGLFQDLFGRKKKEAELKDTLNNVLSKYEKFKDPYFINFSHITKFKMMGDGSSEREVEHEDEFSDKGLFLSLLVHKGFSELVKMPKLLDKLLFTTNFYFQYGVFSRGIKEHIHESLELSLRSWIEEYGTSFRYDLSLFFYYVWKNNIKFEEIKFNERVSSDFNAVLLDWRELSKWIDVCERIHYSVLVRRFSLKLEHFDPNEFVTMYHVDAMGGYEFEDFLAVLFQTLGYEVERTPLSNDQGADLFITRFGKKTVIQAKNYAGNVGNGAVQEAIAAQSYYDCDAAMVITNSYFTRSAIDLSGPASVQLIGRRELQEYLDEYNQHMINVFATEKQAD